MLNDTRFDFPLMVDCYMALTVPYAIKLGKELEALNVKWMEEFLPPDDYAGYCSCGPAVCAEAQICPQRHNLLRDWARPCHICPGTGLAPATSAHRDWSHSCADGRPVRGWRGTGGSPGTARDGGGGCLDRRRAICAVWCRYTEVRQALRGQKLMLTTGEHEYTAKGFRLLIEGKCADIIQPDISVHSQSTCGIALLKCSPTSQHCRVKSATRSRRSATDNSIRHSCMMHQHRNFPETSVSRTEVSCLKRP
jgi:hypothetical protein